MCFCFESLFCSHFDAIIFLVRVPGNLKDCHRRMHEKKKRKQSGDNPHKGGVKKQKPDEADNQAEPDDAVVVKCGAKEKMGVGSGCVVQAARNKNGKRREDPPSER